MKKTIIPALALILLAENTYAADNFLADLFKRKHGVEPVKNELYEESCGECHFPYQPGWLPEASWEKLLAQPALEDHFGENAELTDEEERLSILDFLTKHAAEHSSYKVSKKIIHSLKDDKAPKRITKTRYIQRKHDEIPPKLIKGNKKVRLLSNCDRCHKAADKGEFTEDTVFIPGAGRWIDID